MQWARSPHQQPREVSKVRMGWIRAGGKLRVELVEERRRSRAARDVDRQLAAPMASWSVMRLPARRCACENTPSDAVARLDVAGEQVTEEVREAAQRRPGERRSRQPARSRTTPRPIGASQLAPPMHRHDRGIARLEHGAPWRSDATFWANIEVKPTTSRASSRCLAIKRSRKRVEAGAACAQHRRPAARRPGRGRGSSARSRPRCCRAARGRRPGGRTTRRDREFVASRRREISW